MVEVNTKTNGTNGAEPSRRGLRFSKFVTRTERGIVSGLALRLQALKKSLQQKLQHGVAMMSSADSQRQQPVPVPVRNNREKRAHWHGESLYAQIRESKLAKLPGSLNGRLNATIEQIEAHRFNIFCFGLVVLSVPALVQLIVSPFRSGPSELSLLSDPIQTHSISPRSTATASRLDMWQNGWRTGQGRSLQIFGVESPETTGLLQSYTARTHISGAREDALSWSKPASADQQGFASQSLMVIQRGIARDAYDDVSLYVETTRRAATLGLSVTRAAKTSTTPGKFGPVEVMDLVLTSEGKTPRSCLAFRADALQPALRLTGWLCGAPGRAIERPQLTCFVNRLDLMGAAHDKPLQKIFLGTEAKRGDCPSRANLAATTPGRNGGWLETDSPLPALKGVLDVN